jgi:hypothetical protein
MKGIVFNMLQYAVETSHGADGWDRVLRDAGSEGAFTSLGSYPDGGLLALVAATGGLRGTTDPQAVIRWFACASTPYLVSRYPHFFAGHRSLRTFLPTLNDVIYPEVRKAFPGAVAPEFRFGDSPEGYLVMEYHSPRKLCAFGEGLVEGAARHFGETVAITQPICALRGDDRCVLVCDIRP